MDNRVRREREAKRIRTRKRRQRQIVRRSLLFTVMLLAAGMGIRGMVTKQEYQVGGTLVKAQNADAGQMMFSYLGEKEGAAKLPEEICIVLDAGHGGKDPGALWGNIYEKDINLAITRKLKEILMDKGYRVIMTRDGDDRTVLSKRVEIAEDYQADVFVSVHQNALENDTATEGIEVYYNPNTNEDSRELAELIQADLLTATGAKDQGVEEKNELYLLNHSTMPTCLVEAGFLTAAAEREKLLDENYQQKIAEGIANGIMKFLEG